MAQPSEKLQKDILRALKLKQKAEAAKKEADAAVAEVYEELEQEGLLDPDTKAVGMVRTVIAPNRFFSEAKALELKNLKKIPASKIKQATVSKIDGSILKALIEPALYEQCMDSYSKKYKITLKVND